MNVVDNNLIDQFGTKFIDYGLLSEEEKKSVKIPSKLVIGEPYVLGVQTWDMYKTEVLDGELDANGKKVRLTPDKVIYTKKFRKNPPQRYRYVLNSIKGVYIDGLETIEGTNKTTTNLVKIRVVLKYTDLPKKDKKTLKTATLLVLVGAITGLPLYTLNGQQNLKHCNMVVGFIGDKYTIINLDTDKVGGV